MKKVIMNLQILLLVISVACSTAIGQTVRKDTIRRGVGTTQGTYDRNGRIVGNDSEGRNQRGGTVMTDTARRRGNNNADRTRRNGRMEGDTTGKRGGMNYDKMNKKGKMHKYPMKKGSRMKRDTTR